MRIDFNAVVKLREGVGYWAPNLRKRKSANYGTNTGHRKIVFWL